MSVTSRILGGAAAGAVATVAMTGAFGLAKRVRLLRTLPPTIIVGSISPQLGEESKRSVAAIAHVAYGAGGGSVFSVFVPRRQRNMLTGAIFGIALWAAGYEGWLPFLDILPPAHRDSTPRAIGIFIAHVVYGAALGRASRGSATLAPLRQAS